ncbi:MAG: UDP-N-acetylmuramyl pentapeptide phosphotransferase, partial [Candidatus Cloacimonas sp. 4484_275]
VLLSLILIGSNLAFLRFNFYPAKIFMGDTGSLFIGFNIAAISVIGSAQYKGITTMTLLIPIIASVIPLTDTFLAVFRRIKNRKNIFQADKEHLHHKMLELGFSQKTVAVISYIVTFIFGLTAFGFSFAPKEILLIVLLILIFILSVFIFIILKKGMLK